ncbi:MAG: YgfZ/GcvT domain-containing protein [Limnohabitans sp.]
MPNTPFASMPHDLATQLNGQAPLPHLGVIQAQGEDAAHFLHNQLSNDVLLLPVGQSRLAAFCSAKGRMQASFVVIKTAPDTVLLVMPQDLLAQTLKRLSMFVLRAKVKLTDATAQWPLRGLLGETANALLANAPAWQTVTSHGAHVVALYPAVLADSTVARALWVAPAGTAWPEGAEISSDTWQWTEVMSGVTLISQAVYDAFVPQMLNYESVGGVNFKKGCYPGQEVVARSQFRGTLKRRAYRVHADAPLLSGQEVFHSSDPEQPCGLVAAAAPCPTGGFDAIVSMQTSADTAPGQLSAISATGPHLTRLPLPYPLLEDI